MLRDGIIQTAQAIGADPLDLATVISYETAGTFDPLKKGPTTQWGQHRGLIQFGEPQAQRYGVDWENPVDSQLGADGAVARYFKESGFKPGMGLLDMYSTVNAGAPGLYGRSDANNGGAPGTVRDKVEQQMQDHRRKAAQLLGMAGDEGMRQPTVSTQGQAPQQQAPQGQQPQEMVGGIVGKIFPNMTKDSLDRISLALMSMDAFPTRATMQMMGGIQDRIGERRDERKQQGRANKTVEALRKMNTPQASQAIEYINATGDGRGGYAMAQKGASGPKPYTDQAKLNADYRAGLITEDQYRAALSGGDEQTTAVQTLKQRAAEAGLEPGAEGYREFMLRGGRANGLSLEVGADGAVRLTQGDVDTPDDVTSVASPEAMVNSIDGLLNDPALDFSTGFLEFMQNIPGTASRRFGSRVKQLNGQAFLRAFDMLKGGGHITEIEGQKATEAIGRLDSAQRPDDYRAALNDLKGILEIGMERKRSGGSITSDRPGRSSVDINGTTYTIEEPQ